MALPSQTFEQFVQGMTSQWAAYIGITPAFQSGDALLAIFQAVASQDLFLQAQAQLVNDVARLSTSSGGDVDSFINGQFGLPRLAATYAEGPVTLSAPGAVSVPVNIFPTAAGPLVQTPGGTIQYMVIADATQPTWNASLGAYVLASGQTSLTATAVSVNAGSASNVQAGQIVQLGTPVPGITAVTNASPITNGMNAESDAAYIARFQLWLNSLSKATENAILAAVAAVRQGINVNLLENQNTSGSTVYGQFVAVIDDGSGSPPSSLLTAVANAINAVRGFTIRAVVTGPTVLAPTIALNIRVAWGYTSSIVQTAVAQAVLDMADALLIGQPLFVSAIEQAALTVAGCRAVQPGATLINGVAEDLTVTGVEVVQTVISSITVGTY